MLVIVSDLHFTDNGFSSTIPAAAFRVFRERLRDMAYDASWRADGKYRPIERVDVVLLGDILDLIRSERWPCVSASDPAYVRPWSSSGSPIFQEKVREITSAILDRNEESLQVLRSLNSDQVMTIPPATARGAAAKVSRRPDSPARVPVRVNLHYVVGNHDWMLHLPGASYDEIRRLVISRMGLANPPGEPFPHQLSDSPALALVCGDHRAVLRHGDIHDEFNFAGHRLCSSLGDAIVIELLNRFVIAVGNELGDALPGECLDGLRQIDHVRPLLIVPVWVAGLMRQSGVSRALQKKVKSIWNRLADEFLEIPYVRERTKAIGGWTLKKLELALKFSQAVSLSGMSQLLNLCGSRLPGSAEIPGPKNAANEPDFKNRRARTIVYGHTHHHTIIPLQVGRTAKEFDTRIYANSGTWRVVNEQAVLKPENQEFMSYWVMSYLGIYKDCERGGRPFESWSGSLALPRGGA